LVQNPPANPLTTGQLDKIYALDYTREVHPYYLQQGDVKAQETIKFSVTTHRGCYGECNFCSITAHQGRIVVSRSEGSIIDEVTRITAVPGFKGYITDAGGPTANMYGIECRLKLKSGSCKKKRCVYPAICDNLNVDHAGQIELLQKIGRVSGIKKVFVASGIRHDMVMEDKKNGFAYMRQLVNENVSGQLKLAPEHSEDKVLCLMGKSGMKPLKEFRSEFNKLNNLLDKKQFLTYYLIVAHPGCDMNDMLKLKDFLLKELKHVPEQVQVFTPTPSTYSTLMYYTELDPFTGKKIFVEKDLGRKEKQKYLLVQLRNPYRENRNNKRGIRH
jgi:uncharacterized radical SAM protein YgiQ